MEDVRKITHLKWGQMLSSDAGREGLLFLRERRPVVHKGLPHEIQFDAGYSEGYARCIDDIETLLASSQDEKTEKTFENP